MPEETKNTTGRAESSWPQPARVSRLRGHRRQHVNKWGRGKQQPNLKYVPDIARFLNLSTDELLSGSQQAHFNLDDDEFFLLELNALNDYIHLFDKGNLSDERRKKITKRAKQSITFLIEETEK